MAKAKGSKAKGKIISQKKAGGLTKKAQQKASVKIGVRKPGSKAGGGDR